MTVYLPDDEISAGYEVDINGTSAESGTASSAIELGDYGETIVIVISVSATGYTSSTYTLYITRGSPGIGIGYIILIVVAVLVVFALIILAIYFAVRKGIIPAAWFSWFSRGKTTDYVPLPQQA